jgi:phage shock protein A
MVFYDNKRFAFGIKGGEFDVSGIRKLVFNVDSIDIKEEIENSQFKRARARIFASGDNLHGMPVLESALYDAESTIYDKPLIWKYNKVTDDAMEHEEDQVPCGFVPRIGANVAYERADDGRLFFVVDILIWSFYCGKLLEVFKKADDKKSVSVEIAVIDTEKDDDGNESIKKFVYYGITILGSRYTPAIPDASIQLEQFSVDKSTVENILQQSFLNNKPKEKEGDDVVSFNKDEYAKQFSMTANQMKELLHNACREEKYTYEDSDYQHTRYYLEDYSNEYVYAYDCKEDKYVAIPYSIEEAKISIDFSAAKPAIYYRKWEIVEEVTDVLKLKEFAKELLAVEFEQKDKELTELKEQVQTFNAQKEEYSTKIAELEEQIEAFKSDNASLLEFKSNVEKEARLRDMEYVLNSVSEDLTPQQIDEWREKMEQFESSTDYSNQLKAFAYENSRGKQKKSDNIVRAALPKTKDEQEKHTSLWEKYK